MGEGRKKGTGGGGAALNFKVVGNPQPANPKENTIWLNTDVKITGYSFAAEQPEEMQPGEVWISTGTASPVAFDALKKNTVMVYPISAKQMQNGTLVDVTAKSWQNGQWVEWITTSYLYNSGDSCTDVGGEWISYYNGGSFKLTDECIDISSSNHTSGAVIIGKNNTIDVTNINEITLKAEIVNVNNESFVTIGLATTKVSTIAAVNSAPAKTQRSTASDAGKTVEVTVDVSAMSGQYYVFICNAYLFDYNILSVKYTEVA